MDDVSLNPVVTPSVIPPTNGSIEEQALGAQDGAASDTLKIQTAGELLRTSSNARQSIPG